MIRRRRIDLASISLRRTQLAQVLTWPKSFMAQVFYGPSLLWPMSFMAQVLHVFRGLSSGLGPALVNNAPVCGPAYLLWPFVLHGGTPYETKGGFLELSSQLSIDLTHARELRSLNRGAAIEN